MIVIIMMYIIINFLSDLLVQLSELGLEPWPGSCTIQISTTKILLKI
jgi:hypothetical protein